MVRVASGTIRSLVSAPWNFTPPGIRDEAIGFRPSVVPENARITRCSLPFGSSITVAGLAYRFLRLSAFWNASISLPTARPNLPFEAFANRPIEAIDGTPVIDIKPVLCEIQKRRLNA